MEFTARVHRYDEKDAAGQRYSMADKEAAGADDLERISCDITVLNDVVRITINTGKLQTVMRDS